MRKSLSFFSISLAAIITLLSLGSAQANKLVFYNWPDYTAPELLTKFEEESGIKVILKPYVASETMMEELRNNNSSYDVVVAAHSFVARMIWEELISPIYATELVGYQHLSPSFINPPWDQENTYTIPYQWGTTSFTVDSSIYSGDIDTYETLLNPPKELQGKVGMFRSASDVIPTALLALGLDVCSENPADYELVRSILHKQKPHINRYSSDDIKGSLLSGETAIHQNWNGNSLRTRLEKPSMRYAFPREGIIAWADNITVTRDTPNYKNAIKFVEFLLRPENIAMQSNFAGYANGVKGSEAYMDKELTSATELTPPPSSPITFSRTCSVKSVKIQEKIWQKLLE